MINIDFYRELSLLYKDDKNKRIEKFRKLNSQICKIYGVENEGIFSFEKIRNEQDVQTDIGSFDVFDRKMILESTYVEEKDLTQIQLYEIIEALLHEPKHLKQLIEYEKDNSKYPGFYASLPTNLGYHSQKEEDEAYISTFNEIQEIIDNHKNAAGKEKEFYNGLQEYLDYRIKEHENFKIDDIKSFENLNIKLGTFLTTKNRKQENLSDVLKTVKEELHPNIYLDASYKRLLSTCTNYEVLDLNENKCSIFEHNRTWYCKIESKNTIDFHKGIFEIKDNNLNISTLLGISDSMLKYNFNISKNIYKNILKIKDFYEKENNTILNIHFAKFQIDNDNKEYNSLIDKLKNIDLNIDNINNNFELARIKTSLKDFLLFDKKDSKQILKEFLKTNILDNDTKNVLKQIDINDIDTENALKYYFIKTLMYNNKSINAIDAISIKMFQDNLSPKYLLNQIESIKNNYKYNIQDDIDKFKNENKDVVDYITKRENVVDEPDR